MQARNILINLNPKLARNPFDKRELGATPGLQLWSAQM